MENEFDYYLINSDNNPNYPNLDYKDIDEKDIFFEDEPDFSIQKIEICFWKPKPKKPETVTPNRV